MSRIQNKKEQKRKLLMDAAYNIFSKKSISNTSINDIVTKAGVAKGTFYLYFNDKINIANALAYEKTYDIIVKAARSLERVKVFNIVDAIHYFANNIIDQLSAAPELLDYFFNAIDWTEFIDLIKQKKNSGDFDCLKLYNDFFMKYKKADIKDPEIMIFIIMKFIVSSCYSPIKNGKPCSVENFKPYIFKIITSIINLHLSDSTDIMK